jgi:hypothetical protein
MVKIHIDCPFNAFKFRAGKIQFLRDTDDLKMDGNSAACSSDDTMGTTLSVFDKAPFIFEGS